MRHEVKTALWTALVVCSFFLPRMGMGQLSCCHGLPGNPDINGSFNRPMGIAVDYSRGRTYVGEQFGTQIKVYGDSGNYIGAFPPSAGTTFFDGAQDVAVDELGNIFISDYNNFRIVQFDANWNYVLTLVVSPTRLPRGLWAENVGGVESLFVPSSDNYLYRYDGIGGVYNEAATFGGGLLDTPTGVTKDGPWVYVADYGNQQIVRFDMRVPGSAAVTVVTGIPGVTDVFKDLSGYFYVAAYGTPNTYVYTPSWTGPIHQCTFPGATWAVAVNQQGDVLTSLIDNTAVTVVKGCVVEMTPTPGYLGNNPPAEGDSFVYPSPAQGPQASVSYQMLEAGRVEVSLWNEKAERVLTVQDQKTAGVQVTTLDISRLATGVYFYRAILRYDSGKVEKLKPRKFVIIH